MEREQLRRLLLELVSIPSFSGSEQEVARYLKERFSELGLRVTTDSVGNVWFNVEGSCEGSTFHYVSHIDTVRPFVKARAFGDYVYGRGAVDAKGPLLSMIASLSYSKSPCITVLGLVGEEKDSRGAKHLVTSGLSIENLVVGEPSANQVCLGYRGKAYLRVMCTRGHAHPASPAESPIVDLSKMVILIESLLDKVGEERVLGTPTTVRAGGLSRNVVPSKALLLYDVRFSQREHLEELVRMVTRSLPEGCKLEVSLEAPPVEVRPTDVLVKALVRSLFREGVPVRYIRKAGTSDMNVLAQISRHAVSFGPGDPSLSHTLRERISVGELQLAARVLARLPTEYEGLKAGSR